MTDEKAPLQYNIPERFAAYIRNTSARFVDKILNGQKTVETRNDRTLDSYIGKWMPILKTETGEVVGEAHQGRNINWGRFFFPSIGKKEPSPIPRQANAGVVIQFTTKGRPHAVNLDVESVEALKK